MPFEKTISYRNKRVSFLDQKLLPVCKKRLIVKNYKILITAIKELRIRGAPAIGVAGAYAIVLAAHSLTKRISGSLPIFKRYLKKIAKEVSHARPTAINLAWAVTRQLDVVKNYQGTKPADLVKQLEKTAADILNEDLTIGCALGKRGAALIQPGDTILTHCNAGGLATAGMGSALSLMYFAKQQGKKFSVYVDETRPLLQGARLTTYELQKWGIDCTLICDTMAGSLMQQGKIDKVITGADRIALNGDTANKIGTYSLAVLASYHHIPFYIAAPYSTFSLNTRNGQQIPIEERQAKELIYFQDKQVAPKRTHVYNPAFDVVPARLIKAILTEKGFIYKPNQHKIKKFLKKAYA